jgi:two-component system, LuxR family, response regulator FixJ
MSVDWKEAQALCVLFRECEMTLRDDRIVYIVDDDDDLRDSTMELLQCSGFAAQGYASGHDFLEAFDPDLAICIILDLHMPGISGFQVLDILIARGNTVPIILFSGRSDFTLEEFIHQSGAIALLAKPIDAERIIDLIDHLAAKRAAA